MLSRLAKGQLVLSGPAACRKRTGGGWPQADLPCDANQACLRWFPSMIADLDAGHMSAHPITVTTIPTPPACRPGPARRQSRLPSQREAHLRGTQS